MKQVVIKKEAFDILTPKWTHEYLLRKGIKTYLYEIDWSDYYGTDYYRLIKNLDDVDNFDIYQIEYLTKNIGDILTKDEFINLELDEKDIIDYYEIFKNREDKDLVDIAKEIGDESIVKVVEIPDDVEYTIEENECSLCEYISEKHRVWS